MKTSYQLLISSVSGLIVFAFQLGLSMVSGSLNVSSQIKILENTVSSQVKVLEGELKLVRQDIRKQEKFYDYKIGEIKASIKSNKQGAKNE